MATLDLKSRLDREPVRALLEYLADRLGLGDGAATLEARFDRGQLVRAFAHRGPMGVEELEGLGARAAPPLPP